jgi:hypothetical protein
MKMRKLFVVLFVLVFVGLSSASAGYSRYSKHPDVKRVEAEVEEGEEKLSPPISVMGNVSFGEVLSIISQRGIKVKTVGDIPLSKVISVSMRTDSVQEFLDAVCRSADVWCSYDPYSKTLTVRDVRIFTFDFLPEGKVSVSIGEGGEGGEESSGRTGMGMGMGSGTGGMSGTGSGGEGGSSSTFVYSNTNLSAFEFIGLLQEFFGKKIKFLPSQGGYITVALTPSQWEFLNSYFTQDRMRKEVVDVEITLLRVDLNKDFKWGIDWEGLMYRSGKIHSLSFGVNSGIITEEEKSFFQISTKSDPQAALINALSKYGKVYKVDSWHTQGLTGSLIPFGNYQRVKYFVVGSTSTDAGTETTITDKTVEVGFLGSLVVFKNVDGYYVEGSIDISEVLDWVKIKIQGAELKAPEVIGKKFRIATRLSSLGRTLVIGGFRVSGFQSTEKGVPILQKIPVLGWLFKGKEDLKQNSEFVVLITLKEGREGITPEAQDVQRKIKKLNPNFKFTL